MNLHITLKFDKSDVATMFLGIALLVLAYGIVWENKMRYSYCKVVKKITIICKRYYLHKNSENCLKKLPQLKMHFIIKNKK